MPAFMMFVPGLVFPGGRELKAAAADELPTAWMMMEMISQPQNM